MIGLAIVLTVLMAGAFLLLMVIVVCILIYSAVEWLRMAPSDKLYEFEMLADGSPRPPVFAFSRWLLRHAFRLATR